MDVDDPDNRFLLVIGRPYRYTSVLSHGSGMKSHANSNPVSSRIRESNGSGSIADSLYCSSVNGRKVVSLFKDYSEADRETFRLFKYEKAQWLAPANSGKKNLVQWGFDDVQSSR